MTEIAKDRSDTLDPSTDGQMKDITSVIVTAMPDHEVFDRKKMEYWGANKKLLKMMVRQLLEDVPDVQGHLAILKYWEQFYREVLKVKVDFSDIDLPPYGSTLCRNEIIPVVAEITTQEILGLLKENFPIPFSVKGEFPNVATFKELYNSPFSAIGGLALGPNRPSGHYGILHRGGRSPDLDMKIVSVSRLEDLDMPHSRDLAHILLWNTKPHGFSEEFMSPKEYLLFAAYKVWDFHRRTSGVGMLVDSPQWFDLSRNDGLHGTAFPLLSGNGYSAVALGCPYFPGRFEIEKSDHTMSGVYGRRVRVLSSLRNA